MINTKKIRTVASLEARLTSRRLPNKILKKLYKKKVIDIIVSRLRKVKKLDDFFVAIPNTKKNNNLAKYLKKKRIKFYRGSEENVLERIALGGIKFKADLLVRLTCDNPFVDIKMIDEMVKKFKRDYAKFDYFSNNGYAISKKRKIPKGLDIEIVKPRHLKEILDIVKRQAYKTFPTSFYYKSKQRVYKKKSFKINNKVKYVFPRNLSLTLDTKRDFEFLNYLFKLVYSKHKLNYDLNGVLHVIKDNKKKLKHYI
jgi:spore coat polysaccharide biosynthesis protein SpsF